MFLFFSETSGFRDLPYLPGPLPFSLTPSFLSPLPPLMQAIHVLANCNTKAKVRGEPGKPGGGSFVPLITLLSLWVLSFPQ